jgi:hypothetical protein
MAPQLRQLLHAYASRRSPWGPPWWIYGVAFGVANLVRQALIIVTSAEIPQGIRVASWMATALVVITVNNSLAVVLQRRGDGAPSGQPQTLDPIWPLRRRDEHGQKPDGSPANPDQTDNPTQPIAHSVPGPSREETVMNQQLQKQAMTSTRWAPWWIYFVIIVGANSLRRAVVADGGAPAVRAVVALAFSATLFIVLTVVYRANVRRDGTH